MKRLVLKFYKIAKQNGRWHRKTASKNIHQKAAYMIRLTFVYILYSQFVIVCMYKKHTKVVSVSQLYRFCIVCSYLNYLYVQETYKGCFSLASTGVLVIARFYIQLVYHVQETFKVSQLQKFCSYSFYIFCISMCRSLMYIFCTFTYTKFIQSQCFV